MAIELPFATFEPVAGSSKILRCDCPAESIDFAPRMALLTNVTVMR